MDTVVLTGSTGVFGKFLVDELLKTNSKLVLLIRAESQPEAEDRAKNILKQYPKSKERISVLKCDLTQEDLGLNYDDYPHLIKNATHVLHAAASTRFTLPLDEARRNNVDTTRQLLRFAKKCKNLKRFGFVSTAFVAGKRSGVVLEEEFEHEVGFLNTYEESKFEAERVVRSEISNIPIVILRPSLIITPFHKSSHSPVSALTLGLFLARKGFLPILPGNENNQLDIIGGTQTAQAIVKIILKNTLSHLTYHITSANNSPLIADLLSLIEDQSGKKLPIRFCGDMESFTLELKKVTRFRPDLIAIYKKTQSFLPELAYPKNFDNRNLLEELKTKAFSIKPINGLKSILK